MKISREAKIGVFAFAMLMVLYAGNNYLSKNERLKRTNTYFVEYEAADGLQRKSPVLINGVQVGTVTAVSLNSTVTKVLVTFQVNAQYNLPRGTTASVTSGGILDKKNITLLLPPAGSDFHKSNDTLIASPAGSDLLGMAAPMVGKADSLMAQLNVMAGSVQAMLNLQNQTSLATSLTNMAELSSTLNRAVTELNAMLAENRQGLAGAVNKLGEASGNLSEVSATLKNSNASIGSIVHNADSTMAHLAQLSTTLDRYVAEGTLLSATRNDSLYINLNRAAKNLDALLVDIKQRPKEYVQLSVFGK